MGEEETGLCRIIHRCLFGTGLKAPEGEGKGLNAFYFSLLSPFGPELLPSCDHSGCGPGHGQNLGETPAVAQDKWQ